MEARIVSIFSTSRRLRVRVPDSLLRVALRFGHIASPTMRRMGQARAPRLFCCELVAADAAVPNELR